MNNYAMLNENKIYIKRELIYEFIREIKDPEKDCTIEDLDIIDEESVSIVEEKGYYILTINWKPTTPSCSFAVNIGLCMRYKLMLELKNYLKNFRFRINFKIEILLKSGTHKSEQEINKQLNDKERYLAAFENPDIQNYILKLIN
jgi:metal-sulfur cluster biosynthetic enzyme